MPEWSLWLIPCVFAFVFAWVIAPEVARTRRPRDGEERGCPSGHRDAVPVEDVRGELVAWLCADPGCGEQLPTDWRLPSADGAARETRHLES